MRQGLSKISAKNVSFYFDVKAAVFVMTILDYVAEKKTLRSKNVSKFIIIRREIFCRFCCYKMRSISFHNLCKSLSEPKTLDFEPARFPRK